MAEKHHQADDTQFYYAGALPVLAGRLRRKLVGYFNGHIPPGTRVGREVRLVKLPKLNWVYGYLIRDDEYGVVLYVPNGAQLSGVEGFQPVRSGREIRQAHSTTSKEPQHRPTFSQPAAANLDDNLDHLTELVGFQEIHKKSR